MLKNENGVLPIDKKIKSVVQAQLKPKVCSLHNDISLHIIRVAHSAKNILRSKKIGLATSRVTRSKISGDISPMAGNSNPTYLNYFTLPKSGGGGKITLMDIEVSEVSRLVRKVR